MLALVAAVGAAAVQHFVYPALSWNRDEPVYLWQVAQLRSGALTTTDGGHPDLFRPWLTASSDGGLFSQYPLGWPLVMLLGSLIGWTGLALSIAAVLAVTGVAALAKELSGSRIVGNLAAILLLLSPILAVQGGVYLNYLFTLGLGTWFSAMFLGAVRLRSVPRVLVAAVAFGWIVNTRTFDALLWAVLVTGWVAWTERGRWREQRATATAFLLGLLPFVALLLAHNHAVTGSALSFPINAKDPLDTFGFGQRRLMPAFGTESYGPRLAVMSTVKHAFFLPWFLIGTYLGVAAAGFAVWRHRLEPAVWFLLGIVAIFPLGYFAFWGTYVSSLTVRLSGPIYHVPLYGALVILVSMGIVSAAKRAPRATTVGIALMVLVTVPVTLGRLGINRELSRSQEPWATSVADLEEPAIVVVDASQYLLYLNPFSRNTPAIDGPIIYSTEVSPELIDLLEAHPDRAHLLQRASLPAADLLPSESPVRPRIELVPMALERGGTIRIEVHFGVPPDSHESVWAQFEHIDQRGAVRVAVDHTGQAMVAWELVPASPGDPDWEEGERLHLPQGRYGLSLGFTTGPEPSSGTPEVVERLHVRVVDGEVTVLSPGASHRLADPDSPQAGTWVSVPDHPDMRIEVSPLGP